MREGGRVKEEEVKVRESQESGIKQEERESERGIVREIHNSNRMGMVNSTGTQLIRGCTHDFIVGAKQPTHMQT